MTVVTSKVNVPQVVDAAADAQAVAAAVVLFAAVGAVVGDRAARDADTGAAGDINAADVELAFPARGAAEVDAGAAGQVPLGQGDGVPGPGGGDGGRQAGRAAPDHHQLVHLPGAGGLPVGRVTLGNR